MALTPEEMLVRYESGASLRDIAREDGRSYEGVRKAMLTLPDGAERIATTQGARMRDKEAKRRLERNLRDRQRQHDLARSRTQIDPSSVILPRPEPPVGSHRSDRIPDSTILEALAAWLRDPSAEGKSPGAYERWRDVRGKDAVPSSATAIARFGTWNSAKYHALNM